jgi:hypothetical protein
VGAAPAGADVDWQAAAACDRQIQAAARRLRDRHLRGSVGGSAAPLASDSLDQEPIVSGGGSTACLVLERLMKLTRVGAAETRGPIWHAE